MNLQTDAGAPLQLLYEGRQIGWLRSWVRRAERVYASRQPAELIPGMIVQIEVDGERVTGMVCLDEYNESYIELQSQLTG